MTFVDRYPIASTTLGSSEATPQLPTFEQMYAKHYSALLYKAHNYRVSDPEGTVQEVFIKAYKKFDQFENRGMSHLPWLLTILRNTVINEVRASNVRPGYAFTSENWIFENQPDQSAEDDFESLEVQESFQETMDRAAEVVGHEFLSVLAKSAIQGVAYAEIAAAHNIKIGTVCSRIYRAVQKLSENPDFRKSVGME